MPSKVKSFAFFDFKTNFGEVKSFLSAKWKWLSYFCFKYTAYTLVHRLKIFLLGGPHVLSLFLKDSISLLNDALLHTQ